MFYYPTVLKHHTGCFSTIWLVATKGIRVPRRDFLKVNVKSTCDDIMNYVLERVPPPRPGLPRPRFSLYLSSQLQYGVIIVYHRQCAILLEELHTIVAQLLKQRTAQKIDMDDHSRQALVLPDALSLLEETEGAQDPLFGVMSLQEAMPSPNTLIQMGWEYLRGASPEHPEQTRPTAAAAQESGITASPDSITLREQEPVAIPPAEFEGVDLVDQHPETLDFLLAQTDHFPEEVTPREQEREVDRGGRERGLERERRERGMARERARARALTRPTTELQPTTLPDEEAVLLPEEEEPGRSVERSPGPPPGQLTPVSVPVLPSPPSVASERGRPSLQLEEVPPPEVKRRRKRQLIFFDPETQISQEALQQQIDNPLYETRRLPPFSSVKSFSAAHLLNNPCNFLPEVVEFLWKQAANITPVSGSDLQVGERGPESTDSEKEREREMVEPAEREEERLELGPREVQRDLVEPEMFDISGLGSLILEGSDQREVSREISPLYTSERDGSIVSRSVSTLQDIPEVMDEFLGREAAAEFPGLLPAEHESAPVLFHSLLSPEVHRKTVSAIFQRLLENLSARKVHAEQQEPYGDILISSLGPDSEDVRLT
ncbi:meiotic recombination protein REC8 homolog [Scophthalmus maximus]|uniref:meiotic recombination protein REC8 homolog n=1 Tax=Scophthalmus maximus TaxID=52904 RepID=UPI001FA901BB|nr:meiotic recombination protein REC8 homolog [Scophthalmus maximus]